MTIRCLGTPEIPNPLNRRVQPGDPLSVFVDESERVLRHIEVRLTDSHEQPESFEVAGPRQKIFFNPASTRVGIVTCGGLCPGLNDVIRALVRELYFGYGIDRVLGIRYGYSGLRADTDSPPVELTVDGVDSIHRTGGTILGSSRGRQDVGEMVDRLEALGIDILFCIGGDGTLHGAHAISDELIRRSAKRAVVGIPKTIDNDIALVYRSFGFQTAVAEAKRVLDAAHVEAQAARNGVGLVKLMGRESGFIAAYATLASGYPDFCLIPEQPFVLEGEHGLLEHLRRRLLQHRNAVIAVAEGAGRELIGDTGNRDASGNIIFNDIGLFLKRRITDAFVSGGEEIDIKYFDPSYLIRSVPADSSDSIFCADLARNAVHAAMVGKTDLLIGQWHGMFTHVPLEEVAGRRKLLHPATELWHSVLATTCQPMQWG